MKKILVLNGPNLNLLGTREPEIYGTTTLDDIAARCNEVASARSAEIDFKQSNHEGELVDWIQNAGDVAGIIINAGAYTHTSVALRDAFVGTALPFVEVHLSNVFARESFRHDSLLADVAIGGIFGLGPIGYTLGLRGLLDAVNERA